MVDSGTHVRRRRAADSDSRSSGKAANVDIVEHRYTDSLAVRGLAAMLFLGTVAWLLWGDLLHGATAAKEQAPLSQDSKKYRAACPDYKHYSVIPHPPLGDGDLTLPFQRPSKYCRTFSSPLVEEIIEAITSRMVDKDLARLFENTFPNTLDTTVKWHTDGSTKKEKHHHDDTSPTWDGPQSFVVTGDINAEWLRDSAGQLAQYQILAKKDPKIFSLILGAINTQAEFVIEAPYCNAFQPPPPSKIRPKDNGFGDTVHPAYEPSKVFECKWEVDSLANFLALTNKFNEHTGSVEFLHDRWYKALNILLETIEAQSQPTFDPEREISRFHRNEYIFQRWTRSGSETLALGGVGNPISNGTGLIRSSFRPSDDATILPFLIPSNAFMAVEMQRTAQIFKKVGKKDLAAKLQQRATTIKDGVWKYGVTNHARYGEVFAFEVDGYGSHILMDDANIPSLLSLPFLGFCDAENKIYQNTRKMILDKSGNPYYLRGRAFSGIGGPHVGLMHAWPMSKLVQAMTSDDDDEIENILLDVTRVSRLGLIHESVNVDRPTDYTSEFFCPFYNQHVQLGKSQKPSRLMYIYQNRKLVRMGEFYFRTNNLGSREAETTPVVRQGHGTLCH